MIDFEDDYRMSPLTCLNLLISFSLIMRRDLLKSKHPVSFSGKKVLGLSRLVSLFIYFFPKSHCLGIFSKFVEFDLWQNPFCILYSFDSIIFIYFCLILSCSMIQLELQFEDRVMQFTVAPVLASMIMKFQDQTRYCHNPSILLVWLF